uniref:TPM domain-containing protein n=1 Tax=Panagrolaimus davidi TaxID=227884 RepID=A0A914Q2R1_9BILA
MKSLKAIANDLILKWNSNNYCKKLIIIAFASEDRKVWITGDSGVGIKAEKYTEIFKNQKLFFQRGNYVQAILNTVDDLKLEATKNESHGLSTLAIFGIIVGSISAVILFVGICICFWKYKTKPRWSPYTYESGLYKMGDGGGGGGFDGFISDGGVGEFNRVDNSVSGGGGGGFDKVTSSGDSSGVSNNNGGGGGGFDIVTSTEDHGRASNNDRGGGGGGFNRVISGEEGSGRASGRGEETAGGGGGGDF